MSLCLLLALLFLALSACSHPVKQAASIDPSIFAISPIPQVPVGNDKDPVMMSKAISYLFDLHSWSNECKMRLESVASLTNGAAK